MAQSDPATPEVRVDVRDHILIVTIDRPHKRNAINGAAASALEGALGRLESDDALWIGVITGAAGVFSAGADIQAGAAGERIVTDHGWGGIARFERTKPLIAAVEGYAFGGGCEIALACDLITAGTSASFALPEVRRSFIASGGGLWRLADRIPRSVALEMAMTGLPISAERAFSLGLVNTLVDDGAALDAALQLADRIAEAAPLAVRASRRVMLAGSGNDDDRLFDLCADEMSRIRQSADYSDGLSAFIDERPPVWRAS
jgi:enoyl-CoA hydratase